MCSYKIVHQCDVCGKVYTDVDRVMYGICGKCGTKGRFTKKIGKRTLKGWKIRPYYTSDCAWSDEED